MGFLKSAWINFSSAAAPAVYRASASGDANATIVPEVNDLLIVFCAAVDNSNDTPTCTDDNSGTYTMIDIASFTNGQINNLNRLSAFVRTALVPNTTSTLVSPSVGESFTKTVVIAISGMTKTGATAILNYGKLSNQGVGVPSQPSADLSASATTTNITIGAVANLTNPATVTPGTNWTERQDVGYASPALGLQVETRDSGFTGITIPWGSDTTSWGTIGIELDCSP